MKRIKKIITTVFLTAITLSAGAQKTFEMNLWQNGAPNDNGDSQDTAKVKVFMPN